MFLCTICFKVGYCLVVLATIWPTFFSNGQTTLHNHFRLFSLVSQSEFAFVSVLPWLAKASIFRFLCQCLYACSFCFVSASHIAYTAVLCDFRSLLCQPLATHQHSQLFQSFAFFTAAGSSRFHFNMALLPKQPLGILNLNLKLSEFLVKVPTHTPTRPLQAS